MHVTMTVVLRISSLSLSKNTLNLFTRARAQRIEVWTAVVESYTQRVTKTSTLTAIGITPVRTGSYKKQTKEKMPIKNTKKLYEIL